jgi:hypothetical protein
MVVYATLYTKVSSSRFAEKFFCPSPRNAVVLTNFSMRNTLFLTLLSAFFSLSGLAQQDPKLMTRIDSMMKVTQASNFEKLLDYTYPRLFTLVPREQLIEAMKNGLDTEEFSTTMDSVILTKVYPVFSLEGGQYAKLKHTMLIRMKFKQTLSKEQFTSVVPSMEEVFGKGNVRLDQANNTVVIFKLAEMVAIKDEYAKEWSFVTYNENDETVALLFSKDLIEKLKEYK